MPPAHSIRPVEGLIVSILKNIRQMPIRQPEPGNANSATASAGHRPNKLTFLAVDALMMNNIRKF